MKKYLYDYERVLKQELGRIEQSKISERNKELILKFHSYQFSQDISIARVLRVMSALRLIAQRTGKDLEKMTRDDYEKYFAEMGQSFARASVDTYKDIVKVFHKWLSGGETYPECVKWIKFNTLRRKKLPEDLLDQEDVKRLIKFAMNKRDKAMIAMLWESGARIGELGILEIRHISFDKFGCKAMLDGKTGMRMIRLVNSAPYLVEWINAHPNSSNPNADLWIDIEKGNKQRIGHRYILKMLRTVAKRAGVKKPVNPHQFRHSRATYTASRLTEAQMKEYFGWTQDSDMAARYVHLSGKQVDDAILRMNGLKEEEHDEDILKREACPRCKELNDVNNEYCAKCWLPLTPEAHREIQQTEQKDQESMVAVMKLLQLAQSNPLKVREAIGILQQEAVKT